MHDVLDPRDLVPDEAEQLARSGYDVGALGAEARAAAEAGDLARLAEIEDALRHLHRRPDWPYEEPDDEAPIGEGFTRVELMATLSGRGGNRTFRTQRTNARGYFRRYSG